MIQRLALKRPSQFQNTVAYHEFDPELQIYYYFMVSTAHHATVHSSGFQVLLGNNSHLKTIIGH